MKYPVLLFALSAVFSLFASPLDDVLAMPRTNAPQRPLAGRLIVYPLTADTLVIAGDYDAFLNARIRENYNDRLNTAEKFEVEKKIKTFSYRFLFNFMTAEIMTEYMKEIHQKYQDKNYFRLSGDGGMLPIAANGYWINAVGMKRLPKADGRSTMQTSSAELVPFTYLRLGRPLHNGEKVSIESANGEKASFVYDDMKTISRAIKVNQVGYTANAGEKYAYLGMWLGSLGPMPTRQWEGKTFELIDGANGKVAFTGKLKLRAENQSLPRTKNRDYEMPLDGEDVLEMDFSRFTGPEGTYFIRVPGVGRSWEFRVAADAIGRAYYVQMRGLFHQRSGIAKEKKYTQWDIGADHMESWVGGFAPNDRHYKGKTSCFLNDKGEQVDVRHFEMVRATATDKKLPNVYGGWWDAGDFDRRTYHFQIVDALLAAYLLMPENFPDNQLDLPESGNGIPDIIDEAAWGVDVWRRAQNEKGGVGCWLEATSHPEAQDPVKDVQRYYLALPTRESSILYAAYAAKLARAYRKCGAEKQALLFFESAKKAWNFAMNPANACSTVFMHKPLGRLTYKEPDELPPELIFKAALNLYWLSGDPVYREMVDKAPSNAIFKQMTDSMPAYFLSELAETVKNPKEFFLLSSQYRQWVQKRADFLLGTQRELTYRNINFPLNSGWFLTLAWGNALPFQKGSYVMMAWQTTGNRQYRDAALLLADWMLGANPMGRSMTTGLGKVYPARLLSLPMYAYEDFRPEPIPGLTPYTFSGMVTYNSTSRIFCLDYAERVDHRFPGYNANLLPDSMGGQEKVDRPKCQAILLRNLPVWRRFANLEGSAVEQNEFTVWETIAPAAAAYGMLLPKGWKPPAHWKEWKPARDIRELDGFIFLP